MMNMIRVAATILMSATVNLGDAADTPEPVVLKGHSGAVSTLAWSADGKGLATASDDRTIRVWDPVTGRQTASLPEIAREGYGGPVVAFTPNLEVAAINYWGHVTVRRMLDGKVLANFDPIPDLPGQKSAFRPDVFAMSVSPDARHVATAGSVGVVGGRHGLPGGIVIVWNIETGEPVHQSAPLSTAASSVAWSADGKKYAAGTNGAGGELPEPGEVWVWDTDTGNVLHNFNVASKVSPGEWASAGDVTFSPDGKRVAVPVTAGSRGKPAGLVITETGASVRIWDLATNNATQAVRGLSASVSRVVFSPSGKSLATAGSDMTIRVWDLATGNEVATLPCLAKITTVAFSPDGQSIAAGSSDGSVRVWPLVTAD